eukprot:jgi/Botrbrau1/16099/Bobra.7_2s0065.1
MHKYSMISVRAILRQVSDRSFSVHTQRTPGNSKMKFQLSEDHAADLPLLA